MLYKDQGTLSVEFRAVHMSPFLKLDVVGDEVVYEGSHDTLEVRPDAYGTSAPPPARAGTRRGAVARPHRPRIAADPLEPLRR
ncbi:hypothetical protein SVIOM342S_04437 [Streptomyces violaceorubidus]